MKTPRFFGQVLVLVLLATVSQAIGTLKPLATTAGGDGSDQPRVNAQRSTYLMISDFLGNLSSNVLGITGMSVVAQSGCDYCSEPNCEDYLVCEDWEAGTPPSDPWPVKGGEEWHGWQPASYGGDLYDEIVDTAHIGRPNNRCLLKYRPPGMNDCLDLEIGIPPNDGKVHIRFYIYFPSEDYPDLTYMRSCHFLQIDGMRWGLDIDKRSEQFCGRNCPYNEGYSDPAHPGWGEVSQLDGQTHGYEWFAHMMFDAAASLNSCVETEGVPFFIERHLDEWLLVELMVDTQNDLVSLWVNEIPYVLDLSVEIDQNSIDWLKFSGFSQIGWSSGAPDDLGNHYYIDDIVVSTSYIGPRAKSLELALTGDPADRAIHLSWAISGTLPLTSTWQIAYDGPPGDQPSPISGIISATRAYTLTGLTNYTFYTVTLNAMSGSASLLADTVTVMPTDIFVYLPLVLRAYGP